MRLCISTEDQRLKEYNLNRDLSRYNYILRVEDHEHGGAPTDRVGAEPRDQIRSRCPRCVEGTNWTHRSQ